jgi:streptomycin 6-kinase
MTIDAIQLRDKVLRNIASPGEPGASWLEALPNLLDRLEAEGSVKAGSLFANATEAFVSEAVTVDGQPVALKIPIPGLVKAEREESLLQSAKGRGYVRVLRHDPDTGAMLLERLGSQLAMLGLPIEEQIKVISQTLRQAWMAMPAGVRYPTGAGKASEMSSYISTASPRLAQPCSEKVVEIALRC